MVVGLIKQESTVCFRSRKFLESNGMGCCKSKNKEWDDNFKATDLSSNRCDAIWEPIHGEEATFGMYPPFMPCARFGIMPGVIRIQLGFSGGNMPNPSMESIGDHVIVLNVEFDPKLVKYEELLDIFWNYHDIFLTRNHPEQQSVLFCRTEDQMEVAETSKRKEQSKHHHKIVTEIKPFKNFCPAANEHQHLILQGNVDVMKFIGKNLTRNQLAYSHLACRLEGYVAGFGTPEEFEREKPELYIPEYLAALVKLACEQNRIHDPDAGHMNDWG